MRFVGAEAGTPLDKGPVRENNGGVTSLNQKVIDDLRALESPGSPGFLSELIDLFLKEAVRHLEGLRTSFAAKDARPFERSAHTLKGSSGNLGAQAMARMCGELQEIGRTADWARAAELLPRLEAEFRDVKRELLTERSRS
jgi:HPt (histidine-containing phosphotransfer) domain-containing protein